LVHVVKKGETLYGISRRYRVSTDSLLRWNHVGVLTTGQRLIIYRAPAKARKPVNPVKVSGRSAEAERPSHPCFPQGSNRPVGKTGPGAARRQRALTPLFPYVKSSFQSAVCGAASAGLAI